MDDHVGLGVAHGPLHGVGVQRVGDDGVSADAAELVALGFGTGHPDDVVPVGDQHGNKLLAERTGGAGDEHVHGGSLLVRPPT